MEGFLSILADSTSSLFSLWIGFISAGNLSVLEALDSFGTRLGDYFVVGEIGLSGFLPLSVGFGKLG